MKTKILMVLALLLAGSYTHTQAQDKKQQELIEDASNAKALYLEEDDGMEKFFNESKAYVIFPNVGKGGLVVGAASGRGVVYENGDVVGFAKMKKLDIGLQAGGKAFSEIIFFEDSDALKRFKDDDFEFTANVSAVMLQSGAAKSAQYRDGVAVFAKPKAGLMVDLSVGGQKFDYSPL